MEIGNNYVWPEFGVLSEPWRNSKKNYLGSWSPWRQYSAPAMAWARPVQRGRYVGSEGFDSRPSKSSTVLSKLLEFRYKLLGEPDPQGLAHQWKTLRHSAA